MVIDMLREAGVRLLIDVRSFPKSRSNPEFSDGKFPQRLADHQICYRHMLALGGRRPKQYLLLHGHKVRHLMAPGRIDAARPSEGAHLRDDGTVIYPAD